MKQCLDCEDIDRLSFEQQEKIATLFGEQGNCTSLDGENFNTSKLAERITIGRILDILDRQTNGKWGIQTHSLTKGYIFNSFWRRPNLDSGMHRELCDALWDSVLKIIQ